MRNKLNPGEIIPLTDDDMFCEVFNNKDNMCFIEEFIATYFNYSINSVKGHIKILPRRLTKSKAKEKSKEVDLLLEYDRKKINIEMTTGWNQDIIDRNLVFLSNIHGRQLDRGDKYELIDESVQLNLCSFKNKGKTKDIYYLTNQNGEILTKKFKIEILYMEELKDMCYNDDNEMNMLIGWSKVFESKSKEELEKVLDELVSVRTKQQLISDVTRLSGDEEMVKKYTGKSKWEATKELIERGWEKREKEFEKQNEELRKSQKELDKNRKELDNQRYNIISNLYNNNISVEDISKMTGLSKKEIEEIVRKKKSF